MRRFIPSPHLHLRQVQVLIALRTSLCLFAVLLTSCTAPASPVSVPTTTAPPAPTMTHVPPSFRIIAYATEAIIESLIPYDKLTHINYSFLTPNADGTFNPILNRAKLKQIAANGHARNVKVLISVGGWGWDSQFETMAASPESRSAFVQNLKAFVEEYDLDGVDMDWEYPDPGPSAENFLALIQELRAALPDKLLTTAVVAYGDEYGMGIHPASLALFDFVNVMTYAGSDHGTMEQFEQGLAYWSGRGLPSEKLVMGVPFYSEPGGVSFAKLANADPSAAQLDSFEFKGAIQNYNGIPTIQAKTRIALENAGGIMFWALDHDAQGDLSLVNAIHRTVYP
jgi:chitinase